MHAEDADDVFRQICVDNEIADSDASIIQYVVHIERFGEDDSSYWRRVDRVYEISGVINGVPDASELFSWREDDDTFVAQNSPRLLTATASILARRAELISHGKSGNG